MKKVTHWLVVCLRFLRNAFVNQLKLQKYDGVWQLKRKGIVLRSLWL